MLTKQEFLSSIRTKYPTYNEVDDNTLYDSITTKYPQYKDQIQDDWVQQATTPSVPTEQPTQPIQQPVVEQPPIQPTEKPIRQKRYFSDEIQILEEMKKDWFDDNIAGETIKNRRKVLLKKEKLDSQEEEMLTKMAEAWLDSVTAVEGLKEFRSDKRKAEWEAMNPLQKAWKTFFDFVLWTLSGWVWELWGLTDFVTWWWSELAKWAMEWREFTRETTEWSKAAFAWEIFGWWVVDYAVARGLWKATGLGAWFSKLWTAAQFTAWWAWYWALATAWERWEEATAWDIAIWAGVWWALWFWLWKVAIPVLAKTAQKVIWATKAWIGKTVKYWKALKWGWVEWLEKSVVRDIKRPFQKIKLEWLAPEKAATLSTKANRFKKWKEESFQKMTWESTWEFAVRRWMTKTWDDAVEEATEFYTKSLREADESLKLIDWKYKITKWVDYMWEMVDDLSARLTKTLSKDAKKVSLLSKKYKAQWLSMSETNLIKRIYAQNHKYSFVDVWGEAALRSKNLQDWVRKWQFKVAKEQWFNNLDRINKTTQAWRFYADNLAENLWGKAPNNAVSLTDWIALSGWQPTNVAMFLWKKALEHPRVKTAIISKLSKQTKPSIIKANRESILQSNIKKRNVSVSNILRDRGDSSISKLVKKPVIQKAIIKPKWLEKKVIKEVETKWALINKPKLVPKQTSKDAFRETLMSDKNLQGIKGLKKAQDSIFDDKMIKELTTLSKKPSVLKTHKLAVDITRRLWVAKQHVKEAIEIVKKYIKKYWAELKNKLGDLMDDIADKTGTRMKLMASVKAEKAPLTKLEQAKHMVKLWKSKDEIWKATWWEKGTDLKWKFEIDDSLARIKKVSARKIKKLWDVLEHDELYKNYPEVRDINFEVDKIWSSLAPLAWYNPITNTININPLGVSFKRGIPWWQAIVLKKDALSTILHEVQHNIQHIEGFAKWTNLYQAWILLAKKEPAALKKIHLEKSKSKRLQTLNNEIKKLENEPVYKKYRELQSDAYNKEIRKANKVQSEIYDIQTNLEYEFYTTYKSIENTPEWLRGSFSPTKSPKSIFKRFEVILKRKLTKSETDMLNKFKDPSYEPSAINKIKVLKLKNKKLEKIAADVHKSSQFNKYKYLDEKMQSLSKERNTIDKNISDKYLSSKEEQYYLSAWEVEARNIQDRLKLPKKERAFKRPAWTEDRPRYKQIVNKELWISASIDKTLLDLSKAWKKVNSIGQLRTEIKAWLHPKLLKKIEELPWKLDRNKLAGLLRKPWLLSKPKNIGKLDSNLDSLAKEAKKYKSADEFINKYTLDSNLPKEATSLTKIPINKIRWLDYPELEKALIKWKKISKTQLEEIISPTDDFIKWKSIKNAIEVIKNSDGTYSLMWWNHRVAQALLNWDKEILSWYPWLKWEINLKQIYNQANPKGLKRK